jgi:hypothetical protein
VDYLLAVSYLMYLILLTVLLVILLNYVGFQSKVVEWVGIGLIYAALVMSLLALYHS